MNAWPLIRIEDCADIVSGATPSTSEPAYWDGEICWATPKDLADLGGPYISDTPRKISHRGLASCAATVLPAQSVLFSSRAPIGHVAINTVPMATNQGFKSFVPDRKRLDAKYFYYWLRKNRAYLESLGNGATFKEVSKAVVSRIEIPLPPLSEQQHIAAVLDKADDLRTKRRAALAQLDTLAQSVFLDMFGDPIKNERQWERAKVEAAGRVQLGRQRAPQYQTGTCTRPYVRVANIYENRIDLSDVLSMDFDDQDFAAYRLQHGDILLNEGQSTELVGRPAMWRDEISDCCFQNTLIRFQPNPRNVVPEFALALFRRYFRAGEFAKVSSKTSNVAHLGAGRFGAMPFPLPPIALQREFTARIAVLARMNAAQHRSLVELDHLFASLQNRAFHGELTARDASEAA